jgi:hypothetical protein
VKGVSAVLLLLLKQFRLNHVLQGEHFASFLCEGRCNSLALKLLNRDLHPILQHQSMCVCAWGAVCGLWWI